MIPSLNPHVSPPFLLLKSLLGIHPTILPAESQWPQRPQWSGIPHPTLASFSFLFPSNDHRIISNRHTSQGFLCLPLGQSWQWKIHHLKFYGFAQQYQTEKGCPWLPCLNAGGYGSIFRQYTTHIKYNINQY